MGKLFNNDDTGSVEAMVGVLQQQYPWFCELDEGKRFDYALRMVNMRKMRIQKAKLWIDLASHIGPWVIAAIALLK